MTSKEKIKGILESIGLNHTEIAVLNILLEYKGLRATDIARRGKLNRTTTYSTLHGLIQKGLVTSIDEKNVLLFRSIEPNLFLDYIERQRALLLQSSESFKEILPEIENKRAQKHILPKIQFFKGKDGIKQAYEDTLENNSAKELRAFTGADIIYQTMDKEWIHYYPNKRKNLGIHAFAIGPDTEGAHLFQKRDKLENRTTRIIPNESSFETEINIYENKVAIFSFSEDDPVGIIIEDERISKTLKKIFDYVWKKEGSQLEINK